MRKIKTFAILLIFLLVGCSKPKGSFVEITMADYQGKVDQKESFIIVFSQTTCSYCKEYKEILREFVLENSIDIVYVEIDKEENQDAFDALIENELTDLMYLPATVYMKDGLVEDTSEGALEEAQLQIWLNRNGIELEAE